MNNRDFYWNGHFERAESHAEIPSFFYQVLLNTEGFTKESTVYFALEPEIDWWRMGPIEIATDYTEAMKAESRIGKAVGRKLKVYVEGSVKTAEKASGKMPDSVDRTRPPVSLVENEED